MNDEQKTALQEKVSNLETEKKNLMETKTRVDARLKEIDGDILAISDGIE